MGFTDEFLALRKKKEKKNETKTSTNESFANEFLKLRAGEKSSALSWRNDEIAPVREEKTTSKWDDDDIAPVKEEKRTWFDKGVFDDGYQFGDIFKGILGTSTDATTHIGAGVIGIGEKLTDAGAMLGTALNRGSMTQAANNEIMYNAISGKEESASKTLDRYNKAQGELEKETTEFVAKDLYNEEEIAKKIISDPVKKVTGIDSEEDSFFGEKTDALAQSAGQLGAQIAFSAIPGIGQVGGMALMGTTAFGSEAESAFNQGATFDEGMLSATISAGAEILTEKLGGISFGGKTVTDAIFGQMSSKMTSKLANVLISTGKITADALAEGGEELLSGYIGALGQQMTYMEDKEIEELFSNEDKLESFIGGVVLGGIGGTGEAVTQGKGYVTGLNQSEQKVVDKLYNDATEGKNLTAKEKKDLYNNIVENMDKGDIDTDTIESVLGGDDYKAYKEIADLTDGMTKEFDELGNKTNPTLAEQYKYSSLMEKIKGSNEQKKAARTKLDETMSPFLKNSRLAESYNEVARKKEAFNADLTQYDEKQKVAVERAIKSGVLNNTNKSHALVNTLSKIEADKGIVFDYTNNKKLKESGFALEGKTVNGFEKNGTVTLNVQSAKSWQSTVGHEITHVLEGTDAYGTLQETLFKYAESKGELETRRTALTELYNGIEADIDKELTADLVGDYLFSDKDFIRNLTGDMPTFKKIYNEIKYFCKVATGRELTEIEKVRQEFDKVWKEYSAKNVTEDGGKVNLSISGKNSKTADNSLLLKAEEMLNNGADSETVRQETGWYKGYDGKMRYEIDDSDMDFSINGHFTNPDVIRHRELEYKFITDADNITEAEISELKSLSKSLEGVKKRPSTLGDYLKHDKLFEAYPELKNIKLTFDKLKSGANGKYRIGKNEIVLDNSIRDDNAKIKTTLIHEIQHAIQEIEGFANGSSVEYWEAQRKDIAETIKGARQNLNLWLDDIGYSDFVKSSIKEVADKKKTMEQHWEDAKEFKANSKYAEQIANCEAEIAEFQKQYDEITNGMTAFEQYENTAGEIEARDAENRLNLTAEERKNTRPDIDKENVVFADANYSLSEKMTHKQSQFEIIQETNPMWDDYHTGIRTTDDIRTWEEVLELDDESEGQFVWGDFSRADAEQALKDGTITVYSSYPIENGVFVSTSYVQAQEYAGGRNGKVYSKTIPLSNVAWINGDEGQYAKVNNNTNDPNIRFSVSEEGLENIGKILYNNNSPLAIVNRANSNNNSSIKWVYKAEIFSVTENKLFHEKISEINQGSQAFQKNSIDEFMLPIENKIVFTDGNYETPYISEIIEVLTDSQTEFEAIKERIFDVEKGKSSKQDAVRYVQNVYGKGCVITYTSGNDGVYGWEDGRRKGKTRRTVVRNYLNKQYGRGNDNKINEVKADLIGSAFLNADTQPSLSKQGEQFAPIGNYSTPLNETALAPMQETISKTETVETADNTTVDDIAPMPTDADAPPIMETEYYNAPDTTALDEKALNNIGKSLRETLSLTAEETKAIQEIVQEYSTSEMPNREELFKTIKEKFGEKYTRIKLDDIAEVKQWLRTKKLYISDHIKSDITDYAQFRKDNRNKIKFSNDGIEVSDYYDELVSQFPEFFHYGNDEEFGNLDVDKNQIKKIAAVANQGVFDYKVDVLNDDIIQQAVDIISNEVANYKNTLNRTAAEETAREALDSIVPSRAEQLTDGSRGDALLIQSLDNHPIKTVEDRINENIRAVESRIADNQVLRRESNANIDKEIERLSNEYLSKKDKNTQVANKLISRIAKLHERKARIDADFAKTISDLEARLEKMQTPKYNQAMHKKAKMQEYADWAKELIGNTKNWVDKKIGLQYATNTERRNLRDIVRDENGNQDIAKADKINDELNGQYNREEAALKKELTQIRKKYADLKITKHESEYIQMLGEFRHSTDTELTEKEVKEYYEKHKKHIDTGKVDKVIDLARQDYDNLINRLNTVLREQGMKEIPYRQGYFPHFTVPKQNFVQKLLNWKTQDNEIPTSIAGLTEDFKPVKSWQAFDKTRHSDTTDYNFLQGFDNYSKGALDWIYHIETLQKRRAVENYIRYTHSDEGIKTEIKEVYADENLDADEAQAKIESILAQAENPLNNFVQDFMTHTNILAGKKNSLDRTAEQMGNRKIYTVMMNVQNRTSANMVLANVRSALTNFIPITQSWAQVSPLRSLQATKDTIANAIKDDGMIEKSTFLTNRLREADNLYKTNWDKVLDKAGVMFEIVDNFSSQVIWRSKYNQNIAKGMSESEAIKNADQFAENVMAGRSKGNEPTLFNAKNPLVKAFTMFQLEVNNQYGYFFKDVPNDLKAETEHFKYNLAKGYTTAFIGAYIYNALLEQVAGSGAALDPIGIIEDLLKDLGLFDDEEEELTKEKLTKAGLNFADNVIKEVPLVGNIAGGGRIPISSGLPYADNGFFGGIEAFVNDVNKGNTSSIDKELQKPFYNLLLPVGGGQIKKTVQGLSMFDINEEHPVAGSYTDSGALRFPVEDTIGNRIQAGIFGQYASKNAREYFDNGYAPLKEKQINEYMDVDMPIADYWKYRDGLKGLKGNAEKADYINSLDITDRQKNVLMNNILDRKEDVDMSYYDNYNSFEEFDYAQKNPEKYAFFNENGISYDYYSSLDEDGKAACTWAYNNPEKYKVSKVVTDNVVEYRSYTSDLYDIRADKDANGESISGSAKEKKIDYINNLDLEYGQKIILLKMQYKSDDTYNADIVDYLNNLDNLSYEDRIAIFTELGFTVKDGYVYWD